MSRVINILNYEEYVLDHIDGSLNGELKSSFEAFLAANPLIAAEISDLRSMDLTLEANDQGMDKSFLKIGVNDTMSVHEGNYEMAFALEPNSAAVEDFVLKNPKLKREASLYAATQLSPDLKVVFGKNSKLKKAIPLWESTVVISWRAAATIAIVMGLVGVLNNSAVNVYSPRQEFANFASLQFESSSPGINTNRNTISNAEVERSVVDYNVYPKTKMALLPTPSLDRKWVAAEVLERPIPSYAFYPSNEEEIEFTGSEPRTSRSEELTIAQLIGKEVLGIDPMKAQTTQALIKEGAKKIIDQSDQLALDSDQTEDKRKILRIRAAGIEFKRVRYLASN